MKKIRNRAAVYDDYWKGEIKEIKKSGLHGSDKPRYLVEVAWFYSKAQILAALQGGEYGDIRR
jgi:hypothetical protein